MTKKERQTILNNISYINASDLASYIKNDQLTIKEMMETGDLEASKRIEVLAIVEKEIEQDKERSYAQKLETELKEKSEWESIKDSIDKNEINSFIEKFPNGIHFRDAVDLLNAVDKKQEAKNKILSEIKENRNKFTPDVILEYTKNGMITTDQLISIGIPKIIANNLNKKRQDLVLGQIPNQIDNGYTEIYFWGLPGSGKTCALSAILSTGVKTGDIDPQSGLGQHYMSQLSNIFLSECSVLPPSTLVEYTQYLPFDLRDKNNKKHSIALIELSGEVFRAFYKNQNNLPLDFELQATLERTKEYLKGPNKKFHFFIIDITKDPTKPDNENVTQQQYLRSMTNYLDTNKIFKNTTDGVYIITTKSDVLSENQSERKDLAIRHLNEHYLSFINSLKDLLKKNNLSDALNVIPFSLGEVYFNELCYFDDTKSHEVIELLKLKTSKQVKNSLFNRFKNSFNN